LSSDTHKNIFPFSNFARINPSRKILKGKKVKFVSMENVEAGRKFVTRFSFRKFKGGSKFCNGDTIMARITPSLEHGKTAFIDFLDKGEVGGGSTEFIVLSNREGVSIPEYVYYLTISSIIREPAIKSMSGTSGRQRVDSKIFDQILVIAPDLNEQHAIAKILSDLDEKIELNNQMNKTLEDIAQAIFKRWFIDFEFPNEEGKPYKSSGGEMVYNEELGKEIPKGWRVGMLKDILNNVKIPLKAGKELKDRVYVPIDLLPIKKIGLDSYLPYTEAKSSLIAFERNDILVGAMRIYFHRVCLSPFAGITRTTTFVLRARNENFLAYSLFVLNQDSTIEYANSHSKGSTMPYAVWDGSLSDMRIVIPYETTLEKFNNLLRPILNKIRDTIFEQTTLSSIRDSLLPKLMTGKIRVPLEGQNVE